MRLWNSWRTSTCGSRLRFCSSRRYAMALHFAKRAAGWIVLTLLACLQTHRRPLGRLMFGRTLRYRMLAKGSFSAQTAHLIQWRMNIFPSEARISLYSYSACPSLGLSGNAHAKTVDIDGKRRSPTRGLILRRRRPPIRSTSVPARITRNGSHHMKRRPKDEI